MSSYFKQEMPPPGGYPPIHFEKMKSKRFITNFQFFLFSLGLSFWTFYKWQHHKRKYLLGNIEMSNALVALEPFIEAERDRMYLKNLHILKEEEAKTMKRYPEWIPGTLFGSPRFKTLPEGVNPHIELDEYYMFRPHHNRLDWIYPDRHMI